MSRSIRLGLAIYLLLAVGAACCAASLKLPYGPDGPGRFGAYYTTLKYCPEWDAQWRVGSKADVVVRFDQYDYRLVFWRGTNFMPFWRGTNFMPYWVNQKHAWFSNGCVMRGLATPQYDKLCRYSFASVIESNDARVVVRWRYAPVDKDGNLINVDEMTGWNDWVDEYYTIYPDATGVRYVKLYTSDKKARVLCLQEHWITDSISDEPDPSADHPESASSMQFVEAPIPDWPASGLSSYRKDVPRYVRRFPLGASMKPYAEDKQSISWIMTIGCDSSGKALYPASTIQAPALSATGCASSGYDQTERAYQLACSTPGVVKLQLAASANSPVSNPAFVLRGWGKKDITLAIDAKSIKRGPDFRYGFRKTASGDDLIIWVKLTSDKPVSLEIKPVQGGK